MNCLGMCDYANKVLMNCEKMEILIEAVHDDVFAQSEAIKKYPLLVNDCFEKGKIITDMIFDYVLSIKATSREILDTIRDNSKNEQEE